MHTDRGRQSNASPRLQSTVILEDVGLYDHGFSYLSSSHLYHDGFFEEHREELTLEDKEAGLKKGDNYVQLTYEEVKYFEERGCQWKKVAAPKVDR